jgi:hypothetical protein
LLYERCVGEIPGVRVLFIDVADTGEEPSGLGDYTRKIATILNPRFLDFYFTVGEAGGEIARPVGVDVPGDGEFRFIEAEAAFAGAGAVSVLDTARQYGIPLTAASLHTQLFNAMLEMGLGDQDNSGVIGVIEALAGTSLLDR